MNAAPRVAMKIVLFERLNDAPPGIYLYSQDGKCIGYTTARALSELEPAVRKIGPSLKQRTTMYRRKTFGRQTPILMALAVYSLFATNSGTLSLTPAYNQPRILRKGDVTHPCRQVKKVNSFVLKAPPRPRGRFR